MVAFPRAFAEVSKLPTMLSREQKRDQLLYLCRNGTQRDGFPFPVRDSSPDADLV